MSTEALKTMKKQL